MNIKPKTAVLAILTLSTVGLATAKVPEIDPARIDSMVAEVLRQADQHPNQTAKPDGQAIRKDVVTRLQTLEVLKNEAIKAGLDKDAEVQNQFKNVEAEFYANQYAAYLERQTAVDDAELRRFYDQQTRIIKLQQVSFASAEEVRAAQELLLFVDGARLGYALPPEVSDLTLPALAELADVFYIGGTKCGALFGEAVVITNPALQPLVASI